MKHTKKRSFLQLLRCASFSNAHILLYAPLFKAGTPRTCKKSQFFIVPHELEEVLV